MHDILHDDHKNYAGRPGTIGNRAGNFIAENCDLLIILGSRLNIQFGYNFKNFQKILQNYGWYWSIRNE